jgi:hypothetical protein
MPANLSSDVAQTSESDEKKRWWHPPVAGLVGGTTGQNVSNVPKYVAGLVSEGLG